MLITAIASAASVCAATGECGDGVMWTFENKILTISGSGEMDDYSDDYTPWLDYQSDMEKIVVSEGVTGIGDWAFSSCSASTIELPDSLVNIGEGILAWSDIKVINIKKNVSSIKASAFEYADLTEINVSSENKQYSSEDGVLFNKQKTILIKYPDNKEGAEYYVPDGVIEISYDSFMPDYLEKVHIPDSVTTMPLYSVYSYSPLAVYGSAGGTAEKYVKDMEEYLANFGSNSNITFIAENAGTASPEPMPNGAYVKADTVSCKPGSTVEVPVIIANNTGFADLAIEVGYDDSVLTLENVKENTAVGGSVTKSQYMTANPYNIQWDSSSSDITFNGVLAVLEFKVKSGVSGNYPITVSFYKGRNGDYTDGESVNYDGDYNSLNLSYIDGNVNVSDSARFISVKDLSAQNNTSMTAILSCNENVYSGKLIAAMYSAQNTLVSVKIYDAAENVPISFDGEINGGLVKLMWWSDLKELVPLSYAKIVIE